MNESIEILLAVYNAEAHLEQQLDSLLNQTCRDWRLLVSDDGSTDGTGKILGQYLERFSDKMRLLAPHGERLGAARNFARLMAHATADYCMFCDQDDVWLPYKVETTLQRMKELETAHGKDTPLLIHTDLTVTDGELNRVADSLWRHQKSDPVRGAKLCRLLLQNVVTGCTMMINKALRDRSLPIPQGAIMHDWWLALTAATFGKIGCLSESTVLYRQHGRNDTGALSWNVGHIFRQLADLSSTRHTMRRTQTQAAAFSQRFNDDLLPHYRELVLAYASLHEQSFLLKRYNLLKYGFAYTGLLRNLGLFILV